MSEVRVGENESLDNALRRFKRQCQRSGAPSGSKGKEEHHEKPSVRRKKKSEAARRRKYRINFKGR